MGGRPQLVEAIRSSIVGDGAAVQGPWGPRRITYADYTASGRSLGFLEDFLREQVLPFYANTHSEASGTGLQTMRFREDARAIIRSAVGGDAEDAVVFAGTGATGAIHKLLDVLELRLPAGLDARFGLRDRIPPRERPVVFIGPYEHHSNELPWRESIADVVTIDEDRDGHIDLQHLEQELERHRDRALRIGSFSAASNVTGIVSQTRAITAALKRHGALSFWDFAAAAPYVRIEMNPPGDPLAAMDAIFLSPHKFIGGPGTPGVLVARRTLFGNRVPASPGGGTVSYVSPTEHRYLRDPVQREEGGTPAIVGAIRAGLVFQLKEAVGVELIRAREEELLRRAIAAFRQVPNLAILGNLEAQRLSIVSFQVRHGAGFLHHSFVVALLNDLFGIQARGGCSCAGPYGHRLLGIDAQKSHRFERAILAGCEGIKPGWVRLNFNYFLGEAELRFLLEAVRLVAEHGHQLLPQYAFDPATGHWRHRRAAAAAVRGLCDVTYDDQGALQFASAGKREPESRWPEYLDEARRIVADAAREPRSAPRIELPPEAEALRWFPLPHDIAREQ